MKSYTSITNSIGFNNHSKRVENLFNEYFDTIDLSITLEDIKEVLSYIPIEQDLQEMILSHYETIMSNEDALNAFKFIRMITIEHAHPSEWLLNKEPIFVSSDIKTGVFSLYSLLIIAIYQMKIYKSKQIDVEHIEFNLKHLQGYINEYYEQNEMIGVNNYTWCIYLSSLGLIHLHTLHFMHHVFSEECIVFQSKKTKKVIMLSLGGIDVRYDGQINNVNGLNNYAFRTTYKESSTSYIGHRVNPYGAITNDLTILSKLEYDIILKPGDFVIDFHIPTGKGYTVENTRESFQQAISFFEKIYPQYNYKAFWCLSWLSSPQVPFFINNTESNIYKINQESYTFPARNDQSSILKFVFGDEDTDLNSIIPKTSLERGIINYTNQGTKINCGVFLFLINDMNSFGSTIYRTEQDYQEFLKLNKQPSTTHDKWIL